MWDIAFYMSFSQNLNGKWIYSTKNLLYMNVASLMVASKFKNVAWSHWCSTFKVLWRYIIKRPSELFSIYSARLWIVWLVGMSCLDFIKRNWWQHLFFFIGTQKKICPNATGSIPIGISIDCLIVTFPITK